MAKTFQNIMFFRTITAGGLFILLLVSGISWVTAARFIPSGVTYQIVISVIATLFVAVFLWLLFNHVSRVLSGKARVIPAILITLVNLALLICTFAWSYKMIGILPNPPDMDSEVVHGFGDCLYFSVITLTTAGYGDFYPVGAGKFLAGLETLTGFTILGVFASAGASVMRRRELESEEEGEDNDGESTEDNEG